MEMLMWMNGQIREDYKYEFQKEKNWINSVVKKRQQNLELRGLNICKLIKATER